MNTRPLYFAVIALFVTGLSQPSFVSAQDDDSKSEAKPDAAAPATEAATATDEADATPAKKQTPDEEWAELKTRRTEITKRLAEIREAFATAEGNDQKRTMQGEFVLLLREFESKVEPRMTELAADRFSKDEKDTDAGVFLLNKLMQTNQFQRASEVSDSLMKAGEATPFVKNMAGLAYFATHKFDKAGEVLAAAKEAGDLDAQAGDRYLELAKEYAGLWKKEQEIRKAEAEAADADKNPVVLIKTSAGDIELELFENEAPNTVANFIELTESKAYDGLTFHRVVPNFVIQGGDPNSKNDDPADDGLGGPGYSIKCECYGDDARMHFAGTLSMAHSGRDTGGSQFFITHMPTDLNGRHTAFGRVTKGMDVVAAIKKDDKITSITVFRKRDHEYKAEKTADKETP